MNHAVLFGKIVILLCFTRITYAIKCYKCSPVARQTYFSNETIRLCSQFDYSEKFIVDCPYSTLCMKKVYSVNLTGNFTNGTRRDCTHQKYEYQKYENGQWQTAITIDEEPYKEGCLISDDKGFKISTTSYCYCRGDLCNGALDLSRSTLSVLTVIIIFFQFL